jgi:hypothetical protein
MFGSRQAARQCTRGDIYVMNRNDLAEIQFLTARQFNHITRTHEQL